MNGGDWWHQVTFSEQRTSAICPQVAQTPVRLQSICLWLPYQLHHIQLQKYVLPYFLQVTQARAETLAHLINFATGLPSPCVVRPHWHLKSPKRRT